MRSRPVREAQRGTAMFQFGPSDITGSLKRKAPGADDLEEELARPSKNDYNQVRKALIIARWEVKRKDAAFQEKIVELGEKEEEIRDLELLILEYEKLHGNIRHAGRQAKVDGGRGDMRGDEVDLNSDESEKLAREMALQLRTQIHDFAVKYFSGKLRQRSTAQLGAGWAHQYMQATAPQTHMDYLRSQNRCPMIIQAFIWRFICGTVFDSAPWSGSEDTRRHLCGLQTLLQSCKCTLYTHEY
jgi:hypothetical protein